MKRQFKTFVVAATAIAATTLQTIPTQACGPRGRGGYPGGYVSRAPVYRTVHAQPRYVQPQPVYAQPSYGQPSYGQPIQQQPIHPRSVQQRSVQPQLVQQRSVQPRSVQVSQRAASIGQQPAMQPNQAVANTRPAMSRANVAPTNAAPAVRQPLASANAAPGNSVNANEASALQMLASISSNEDSATQSSTEIPQFTAASSGSTNPNSGTWMVNLPGNQSVALVLNDDSSFSWTATKDGKSNSFQGQFRLENGRLTLVRSNDLQQMTGTWSGQGEKFTFKLDGATTSGLAFVRS